MGSLRRDSAGQNSSQNSKQYQMVEVPIDVLDMLEYFREDQRTVVEGLRLEKSNSVHNLCILKVVNDIFYVTGDCMSGHDVNKVHSFNLNLASNSSVWKLECSCPAGKSGRCKHVMAGVRAVERSQYLPILTCTDVRQRWGVPLKSREVKLLPFVEMSCCVENIHPVRQDLYDREEQQHFLEVLIQASPNSALSKLVNCSRVQNLPPVQNSQPTDDRYLSTADFLTLIERDRNCTTETEVLLDDENLRDFYNSCIKTDKDKSALIQSSSQNSTKWKHERKLRITASVCYQIFTYSKNRNPGWGKKFDNIHRAINTESILYGKNTEQLAFERYKKDEPSVKLAGLCVNPKLSWLGCSPDGVILSKSKILEIKCPKNFEKNPVELKDLKFLCHDIKPNGSIQYALRKKHGYYGQVQLNMYLLNCDTADFVIYSKFNDEYALITVDYDEEFMSNMIISLEKVFFELFLPYIYKNSVK